MIPIFKPIFNKEMEEAAIHSFNNERFVLGESVFKFEEEYAKYTGTDHAVSTSSGTNALQIAMLAMGINGGEVLTTPASFIATSNAVMHANATPVFSDCGERSFNLEPSKMSEKITEKTRAILPVHLYGNPAEMDEINEIAEQKSIPVLEDACQAHGADYKGKKAGNLGSAACFSFYSTKNLTVCGDGGMITTNDEKLAERIAKIRNCGRISQYEHDVLGYTSRLNSANAAIGRVQLKHLDEWTANRQNIASKYLDGLKDLPDLVLPQISEHSKSAYHLFACMSEKRDALAEHLKAKEIQSCKNFPIPIHLQPLYKNLFGFREGDYPNAERLSAQVICLPMFPDMSDEEVKTVIETTRGFFE